MCHTQWWLNLLFGRNIFLWQRAGIRHGIHVQKLSPSTQVFVCDFHREQAWERWVKDLKHGLSELQGSLLLDLLRDCANAPPNGDIHDKPSDYYFQQAEKTLKESDIWKNNEHVRQWMSTTWLSCPRVSVQQ